MSYSYFWNGNRVITVENTQEGEEEIEANYRGMYCLDAGCTDEQYRYGRHRRYFGWVPEPLKSFPKRFRAHLLLMGVS